MKGKKKKGLEPVPGQAARAARAARRAERRSRRDHKLEHRKREKKQYTADQWAIPAPSHLVATLEPRKHKSRYHSYFEFAENTEKKKRLEYKVHCSLLVR
jgi:hypothetical protein